MKMCRHAIHDQQRPLSTWPAAARMSADIKNVLMTKSVPDVPPAVAFFDKEVDVSHMRVPLCDAFPYIEKENRTGPGGSDLDPRRARMIYVGNDEDSRAYRLYDPKTKKVYSRRYADVLFDERPKKQDATPTEATNSPSDVQLFDEDDTVQHAAEIQHSTDMDLGSSDFGLQNGKKGQGQPGPHVNGQGAKPTEAPAESGAAPPKTAKKGTAPPATTEKSPVPPANCVSAPVGFITLQKDRSVAYVAQLFKLDPLHYLEYLRDTPGAKGTWMEKLKVRV